MPSNSNASDNPTQGSARCTDLRDLLKEAALDGFLVPHADEFHSEAVLQSEQRLKWLTGFCGSAGLAIILMDRAAIFVDGRYSLQVQHQVDTKIFAVEHYSAPGPEGWLKARLKKSMRLGHDPRLHSYANQKKLACLCAELGAELVATNPNPIDILWQRENDGLSGPIYRHDVIYAGKNFEDKFTELSKDLWQKGADYALITEPEAIAWLFNLRSKDIPHTPSVRGFAILRPQGRPVIFLDKKRLTLDATEQLTRIAEIRGREQIDEELQQIAAAGGTIILDPHTVNAKLAGYLNSGSATIQEESVIIARRKAIKNEVEIEGARRAHIRDGAAMVHFLYWLSGLRQDQYPTEIEAAEKLQSYRAQHPLFRDLSFDTISAFAANGAIVHYHADEHSNRRFEPGGLYLVDSGAQYLDGTTDLTRTIATGAVPDQAKRHFTLVLKGHIALSLACFPKETTGAQLDVLARQFLWRDGLDYDHGTGHGVGSYLSVHEGPQRIAKSGHEPLQAGMIISNEPGYYREGEYGIRIENLLLVREVIGKKDARLFHEFETLTQVPYDRRLIDKNLLDQHERDWLDAYHANVCRLLSEHIDDRDIRAWLEKETRPL